jgi:hypothetical protein
MAENIFWWFCSSIELYAGILLSLSLFRLPVQFHYGKAAVFSCILGLILFYIHNVLHLTAFIAITDIVLFCFFYTVFIELSFLKSLLVSVTGIFVSILVETAAFFILISTGLTDTIELHFSKWITSINLLLAALLLGVIFSILYKFKLGFMLVPKHFFPKRYLRPYNFILSGAAVIVVIFIIFLNGHSDQLSYRYVVAAFFSLCTIALIRFLYVHNKRSFEKRYERFDEILEDSK